MQYLLYGPYGGAPGDEAAATRWAVALAVAALVASTVTLTSGRRVDRRRRGTSTDAPGRDAQQAGLVTGADRRRWRPTCRSYLNPSPTQPLYAGGVVLPGTTATSCSARLRATPCATPTASGTELPARPVGPARTDTIFDLASVSKLFTSIALVQQVEAGRIDLDRTVASYIPAFAANGKAGRDRPPAAHPHVGLPAPGCRCGAASRRPRRGSRRSYDAKLANPPGTTYLYSDLNMITAGKLVELVTGKPLDQVVARPHHRAAADARHRLQPAGVRARPDRRDGVPDRATARHGPRQRARRERLVARTGSRGTPVSSPRPTTSPCSPRPSSTAGRTAAPASSARTRSTR